MLTSKCEDELISTTVFVSPLQAIFGFDMVEGYLWVGQDRRRGWKLDRCSFCEEFGGWRPNKVFAHFYTISEQKDSVVKSMGDWWREFGSGSFLREGNFLSGNNV